VLAQLADSVCWSVLECVGVCWSVLQCAAACCSVLQHSSTSVTSLLIQSGLRNVFFFAAYRALSFSKPTLQHTATHCNTLQHTATHIDIPFALFQRAQQGNSERVVSCLDITQTTRTQHALHTQPHKYFANHILHTRV